MNRKIFLSLLLMTGGANAQPAPPPEKSVSLDLAREAVQAALDACKAGKPVVALVDLSGNIKVQLASDGAIPDQYEYARRKAYTVLKKGMSSGDFGKQVGHPAAGAPPPEGDANLFTYAGALPIRRGDAMVGAISVSGTTGPAADEACAQAGLDRIKGAVVIWPSLDSMRPA